MMGDDDTIALAPLVSVPLPHHQNASKTTTYNRRERNRRERFINFLQRRVMTLVTKERKESKVHPPSAAMKTLQDVESPHARSESLDSVVFEDLTKKRWCWKHLAMLACGYIFILMTFNMDTFSTSRYLQNKPYMSAYTAVPQFVVASPEVGYLDVVGTTEWTHQNCGKDWPEYTNEDLALSLGHHNTKFSASSSINDHQPSGSILVARFRIGRKQWKSIVDGSRNSTKGPPTVTILDRRQDADIEDLPVWVDPSLSQYYSNHPLPAAQTKQSEKKSGTAMEVTKQSAPSKHFLATTVILRTGALTSLSCGATCLQKRLQTWLEHYRRLGVNRFYIVDNAASEEPSIDLSPNEAKGVTYIRTQIPYEDTTCHGDITLPGKTLLHNAILKAANVEWLLMVELDELVVVPTENAEATKSNLQLFIQSTLKRQEEESGIQSGATIASLVLSSLLVCGANELQQAGMKTSTFANIDAERIPRGEDVQLVRTSIMETVNMIGALINHHNDNVLRLHPPSQAWVAKVDWNSPSCRVLSLFPKPTLHT